MPVEDVETVRYVRRELARRQLDTGETQVCAMRGIIHLNGRVRPIRGHEGDFEAEIHTLYKVLKQRAGVRDVVMEWSTGNNRMSEQPKSRAARGQKEE